MVDAQNEIQCKRGNHGSKELWVAERSQSFKALPGVPSTLRTLPSPLSTQRPQSSTGSTQAPQSHIYKLYRTLI